MTTDVMTGEDLLGRIVVPVLAQRGVREGKSRHDVWLLTGKGGMLDLGYQLTHIPCWHDGEAATAHTPEYAVSGIGAPGASTLLVATGYKAGRKPRLQVWRIESRTEPATLAAEGYSAERAQQVLSEFMEYRHDIASAKDVNRERQPIPITWADFELVGSKPFDL